MGLRVRACPHRRGGALVAPDEFVELIDKR